MTIRILKIRFERIVIKISDFDVYDNFRTCDGCSYTPCMEDIGKIIWRAKLGEEGLPIYLCEDCFKKQLKEAKT